MQDDLLSASSIASPARLRSKDIPDVLICPITHEMMTDPVIASDGHTYERKAILSWFSKHTTSPMTNKELPNLNVIPNQIALKLISKVEADGE